MSSVVVVAAAVVAVDCTSMEFEELQNLDLEALVDAVAVAVAAACTLGVGRDGMQNHLELLSLTMLTKSKRSKEH